MYKLSYERRLVSYLTCTVLMNDISFQLVYLCHEETCSVCALFCWKHISLKHINIGLNLCGFRIAYSGVRVGLIVSVLH